MQPTKKVAILTGSSSGIGFAVAKKIASKGYNIVLGSRHPEAAVRALREQYSVEVVPVAGDIAHKSTTASLLSAATELGGVDALLLNHGGPPVKAFMEVSEDEWSKYFDVMVQGPLRLLREAIPLFESGGGGRVVAISSFTVKMPYPRIILSNSLRAALVNALKTIAQELGDKQILVNSVGPGYIATDRLIEWNKSHAESEGLSIEEINARATANIPLKRHGTPEEVAELIYFLLSVQNGYLTGQNILVDGGLITAA